MSAAGAFDGPLPFSDRRQAGRRLAQRLAAYMGRTDVLVLALPRGGVPVGYEVSRALGVALDVFLVRKLGVPGYEELAMGAVATGGVRVVSESVVRSLGIPDHVIDSVAEREQRELARRERLYRSGRPPPDVRGRTAILVDDGLATGATMQAAVKALRAQQPVRIVVAVPVASRQTCDELRALADEVICAVTPEPFHAVGLWYDDFSQTSDEEVRELLVPPPQGTAGEDDAPDQEDPALGQIVRKSARLLTGAAGDYDALLDFVGDARFVLLGEASHGTHEFYRERARITQRLMEEKGFAAVAAEADWPDAYRVNRYVHGIGDDIDATEALADFRRFPTWMWRNAEVVEFVEWLRAHNAALPAGTAKRGFYGLDLYSLRASMKAVLQFLDKVDPEAAARARQRYACFDHVGENTEVYGFVTGVRLADSCADQVLSQLVELERQAMEHARQGRVAADEAFYAVQNARVVKNAEAYYRSMFLEEVSSWNLRDRHMAETLDALAHHLDRDNGRSKIVVWAHNSHLGDARATEMGERGELNLGQLARQAYGSDAVLVGFTTHHGTVTAASNWGAPAERKSIRRALAGGYETILHDAGFARALLTWRESDALAKSLRQPPRLERAIGVIYRPETERVSHYFRACLADQFDAVVHFDETRAVEPLDRTAVWEEGEVPATFPFAV
jgi:erythromycin esterase-like protein/predicted phosphoribosyltransferase